MANIVIPEFTIEDYKYGTAPYEWLYERRDNKFLLQQLVQIMKEQAGALGVKYFMKLWNNYCLQMASKQKGVILQNSTEFSDQPLELLCGEYTCNDDGVTIPDKYGYTQAVCPHPIMPVTRIINIDNGNERLEVAYKKGENWRSIVVEKAILASSTQILVLSGYGVVVNSENAKLLSTYLLSLENMNYKTIPEKRSVGRLGWVMSNGFSPYYSDLIFDGEAGYKYIFNAVQPHGSLDKWINAMKKMRAEKTHGRFILAASFASVLLEPCGLLPFFMHIWADTEVGKTVGLMIAASVWANPKMGEYITTFNSTSVGQEMMVSFLNSLPLCMDELQIQASDGLRDFDKIIYQLTEGVGRTRGAKTGGIQKVNTWKNCMITTGEHPISNAKSGGGAVNRVIECYAPGKVFSDMIWMCSVITENYGLAGKAFVEYLQANGNLEIANNLQKEYYRELLKLDSTDKQAASASAILAADDIATRLFFNDGMQLTVKDMEQIMTKKEEVNANMRAMEYVMELVARNPFHFKANDFGEYKAEVWGRVEDDCVYIIKSVFDREMSVGGFNPTSFLSWANRSGYLICDKGRRTKKAKIAGSAINTVCIRKEPESAPQIDDFDDIPL